MRHILFGVLIDVLHEKRFVDGLSFFFSFWTSNSKTNLNSCSYSLTVLDNGALRNSWHTGTSKAKRVFSIRDVVHVREFCRNGCYVFVD